MIIWYTHIPHDISIILKLYPFFLALLYKLHAVYITNINTNLSDVCVLRHGKVYFVVSRPNVVCVSLLKRGISNAISVTFKGLGLFIL